LTEGEAFDDVADFGVDFWGCARAFDKSPPRNKPPADVHRPVTARVDQTVKIDFPSSNLEIAQILTEEEAVMM
jgi:hypothetical protein